MPAAARRASARSERVQRALDAVSPEAADEFAGVVEATGRQPLLPAEWGRAPTRREAAEAGLWHLRQRFAARRELSQASLTRAQAAGLLGVTPQAVTDLLRRRHLVGLKEQGEWRLPAWQLEPDAPRGIVPGLRQLQESFPGGVVSLSGWVSRPLADLDGATPRDALVRGRVADVVSLARAAGIW